jgi:hypothetical protein
MPNTLSPEQAIHTIDAAYAGLLLSYKTFEAIKEAAEDGDVHSVLHLLEGPLVAIPPVAMGISDTLSNAGIETDQVPLCNAIFEMVDGL